MSWLSKAFKKIKKNLKTIGKVAVPGLLVHDLVGKAIHKTGNLPFGEVLKAGLSAGDPYAALKPKKLFHQNLKALKQGAPMIAVAAGLGGVGQLGQQVLGEGASLLGGGGPTPIVGDGGTMPSEPALHPSPAVVVGAVAIVGLLLVLVYRRK